MLAARRGCGRPDDSHRQPTAREQPGQVGKACGLGIACGCSECRKRGHRGENLFDDSGVIRRAVAEARRELPFGDRVGDRGQVPHPGEVQPDGCRCEDVGVGDQHVGPSRHHRAFRPRDDQHAAVGDETVDAAGGLDRDMAAAGALRGDLRDVGQRPCAHGDQQPPGAARPATLRFDLGHRALDGVLVGAHSPGAELDHRAVEPFGQPVDDRSGGRGIRPAVADEQRRRHTGRRAGIRYRAVQHRGAHADVHVGQVVMTSLAQVGQDGVRFEDGHGANAFSTASNAAR